MVHEPGIDAGSVEAAQALEPGHRDAGLEFLEADGALGVVDTIFLRGRVGEYARPSCHARGRGPVRAYSAGGSERVRGPPIRAVCAVLRDALIDVSFTPGFEIQQLARGEFVMTHGTLVFLGDLRRGRQGAVKSRVPTPRPR